MVSSLCFLNVDLTVHIKLFSYFYITLYHVNSYLNNPGGGWIVLKGEFRDEDLYFIGYKNNKRKTLSFVFKPGAGTVKPGVPYEARFPDKFGSLQVRKVGRPKIISRYFESRI